MDIRWLQDFLTVAETGNFTRAARIRNVSQAAFSRRIKTLESWLGALLIDRASFPTQLTADGELFRDRAAEIVQQISDARLSLTSAQVGRRTGIRIALPHALATGRLPLWWSTWAKRGKLDSGCTAVPGNVHDTVTALVTGNVDVLICFNSAQQPIHLAPEQYERIVIGKESFRPYVATASAKQVRKIFPGTRGSPLSLLMYSPGAYLARMVDALIECAPQRMYGRCVFESDMASVLRNMAVMGHGVAWLPDCTAEETAPGALERLELAGWSQPLSIVAYRDRHRRQAATERLWRAISMSIT
ncbi:MAG TPA: LysR family transcriptional regulator [Steroidobacteraceae bacterium]|jgi:DNA-binding transcriptional LysR family regulator|nr:LysR family transcriptional regulator [Steroidobacteraceae bacterium]